MAIGGGTVLARFKAGVAATPDPALRRALLASLVMLVFFVIQAPIIFEFTGDRNAAAVQDFLAFHIAAERALAGEAAKLYDLDYFYGLFAEPEGLLWFYPPTMLVLLAPFGVLPYGAAKFVWLAGSAAAIAGAAWRLTGRNIAIAAITVVSPAAWAVMKTGQLSAFFAVLALAGLVMSKSRPILAGALLGVLTVKPQYGLLIPVFLLATGSWRAFFCATVSALILAGLSLAFFGVETWTAFFRSLTGLHADFLQHESGTGRITLVNALRNLGWAGAPSVLTGAFAWCAGAMMIVLAAQRGVSHRTLVALTLMLGFVTAPYIWVYDWLLIVFAALILMTECKSLDLRMQSAMAALWFLPVASYIAGSTFVVPFMWAVAAGATVLFYNRMLGQPMPAPTRCALAR